MRQFSIFSLKRLKIVTIPEDGKITVLALITLFYSNNYVSAGYA
jgi:hypothetical protein